MRYNLYRIFFKNTGVRASYHDAACVFENYLGSISGARAHHPNAILKNRIRFCGSGESIFH
jgi:hypothetical protein